MTYKVEGIILRSQDIKEVDRFYWLFSREKGKQRIIGIGTRRPKAKLASGLEPITKSEIFLIKGRSIDRAKGVIILDQYAQIKNSLEKLAAIQKALKWIEKILPEEEPNEDYYAALDFYLSLAGDNDTGGDKIQLASLSLVWQALLWSGFQPELFRCVGCGEKLKEDDQFTFVVPEGLYCSPACRDVSLPGKPERGSTQKHPGIHLSGEVVKVLRLLATQKIELIAKLKVNKTVLRQVQQVTEGIVESL